MALKRLNDDARRIIDVANDIAHEYELEYVSTEHVLLAILRTNASVGSRVLHNLGVDEAKARNKVNELVQRAKEDTWVLGRLPGTPHYMNVIERAMDVAEQLEATSIGSEHLLLALFHDKESTGRRALTSLGVTLKKCRDEVLRVLSGE
jgi:ATP-dependent Clp protease ATP-binding subunit ClpC